MTVERTESFVVWGLGPAESPIVRGGDAGDGTDWAIATDLAEVDRGRQRVDRWLSDVGAREAWVVVVRCERGDLDCETRGDPSVLGWARLRADVVEAVDAARRAGGDFAAQVRAAERARNDGDET